MLHFYFARMIFAHSFIRLHGRLALFNLLLVALSGTALRYKILYSLPFIDQRNLLHAHSHFAFSGWVSHALMVLLVDYLQKQRKESLPGAYKKLLNANLIAAYGMLVTFSVQGYGFFSILFSMLSILVSYFIAFHYWRELNRLKPVLVAHYWMKTGLVFNVMSSFGALGLAFMMATQHIQQHWYLAAVYFFLHFQYNGWFFFTCMGLASISFTSFIAPNIQRWIFLLFALSCVPSYLLSVLWLPVSFAGCLIAAIAALLQLAGWALLLQQIYFRRQSIITNYFKGSWFLVLPCAAASIKLLLQLGSVIPSLSQLAFGFRPVVIGYLHLILLGVITLFLLGYFWAEKILPPLSTAVAGLKVFAAAVVLNELLLMIQGISAMRFLTIPYINEALLVAAFLMVSGAFLLNFPGKIKT